MKKLALLALIAVASSFLVGCAFSKHTTVTGSAETGFSTNVWYTVNTNNLIIQEAAVQVAAAEAVTLTLAATHNDPKVLQALKNAQTALDGIIHGANQQTKDQVIQLLKAQNNPDLSAQVDKLVAIVSNAEQQLLANVSPTVAGQITIGLTEAVYSGLTVGLNGH